MNEPKSIHIKGARVHNLRNIEVEIPHDTLTVITGLSGSFVNRNIIPSRPHTDNQ